MPEAAQRRGELCANAKLSGTPDTPKGWDAIQRGLDKHKKWTHMNLMRFTNAKCRGLNLGQDKPQHQSRLRVGVKGLGVCMDEKLDIS